MERKELGARLIRVNHMRRRRVQRMTAGYELYPGQLPILEAIKRNPGSTQQDVAAQLGVTPASIALSAKRLNAAGLIEKRVDAENKRRNQLFITKQGGQAAALYRESFDALDAETFAGFSEEEQQSLCGFLDRMIENLRAQGETDECPFWKEGTKC